MQSWSNHGQGVTEVARIAREYVRTYVHTFVFSRFREETFCATSRGNPGEI